MKSEELVVPSPTTRRQYETERKDAWPVAVTVGQLQPAMPVISCERRFPARSHPFVLKHSTGPVVHQGVRSARLNSRHFRRIFSLHVFMTKTITKKMEVTGRKPVETEANESSLPLWKAQHGRVQGAMWKHLQDDGTSRFTVSISRSYKDKDDEKWKNVHYFDRKDLDDIRSICHTAEEAILGSQGMEVVDED